MIVCPYCNYENIEGADECEQCQQSLTSLSDHAPKSDVERSLLNDPIAVLDPQKPLVVTPDARTGDVLQMLVEHSVGCVVVVSDGHPVGIFSERDALRRLNVDAAQLADHPISEFMTPDPETLSIDAKVAFAVCQMDLGGYRHLPIVGKNRPVAGVISVRDILRYLTEKIG